MEQPPQPSAPSQEGSREGWLVCVGEEGSGSEADMAEEAEEGATPLSRFSPSPEPVLVEVSTKDGAHVGSEPGTMKETLGNK